MATEKKDSKSKRLGVLSASNKAPAPRTAKRPGVFYAILHTDLGDISAATLLGSSIKAAETEAATVASASNIVRVEVCRVTGVFVLSTSLKRVSKKAAPAPAPVEALSALNAEQPVA
jgi:hypothetical protein